MLLLPTLRINGYTPIPETIYCMYGKEHYKKFSKSKLKYSKRLKPYSWYINNNIFKRRYERD